MSQNISQESLTKAKLVRKLTAWPRKLIRYLPIKNKANRQNLQDRRDLLDLPRADAIPKTTYLQNQIRLPKPTSNSARLIPKINRRQRPPFHLHKNHLYSIARIIVRYREMCKIIMVAIRNGVRWLESIRCRRLKIVGRRQQSLATPAQVKTFGLTITSVLKSKFVTKTQFLQHWPSTKTTAKCSTSTSASPT